MPGARLRCHFRAALLALAVPACSHDWHSLSEQGQGGAPVGPGSGGAGNGSTQAGTGGTLDGGSGGAGSSGGGGLTGAGNGNGSTSTTVGSGGSSTTCDESYADCEPCAEDCAWMGPCAQELQDCVSENGCMQIFTCIALCPSLNHESCVEGCMQNGDLDAQHELEDLVYCTHCQTCPKACEDDLDCSEWD